VRHPKKNVHLRSESSVPQGAVAPPSAAPRPLCHRYAAYRMVRRLDCGHVLGWLLCDVARSIGGATACELATGCPVDEDVFSLMRTQVVGNGPCGVFIQVFGEHQRGAVLNPLPNCLHLTKRQLGLD
jgi:hypothetical protein